MINNDIILETKLVADIIGDFFYTFLSAWI